MSTRPARERPRLARRRTRHALIALLGSALLVLTALAGPAGSAGAAATKPTIVSLTFDDSNADQLPAEQTMKANGLVGTFYTVDGWIGSPGYLSKGDLASIAADGNEIGGHTTTHIDLIDVTPAEAQRQICDDRATLQSWGYQPVDFAYPFSDANPTVEAIAQQCGYHTSRGLGDIRSPASCRGCPYAETMPPADPNYLQAPDEVDSTWTLATLRSMVTNAVNHGGGWLVLTFHHICATIGTANCPADLSITPTVFTSFVTWLAGYAKTAANQTSVKTVDQTVRQYLGAAYPAYQDATSVPAPPPAPPGVNALSNPSLESIDPTTGFPTCFMPGGWGTNTPTWAVVSPGHTGTKAMQLTITNYSNGDAKLLPTMDLGTCSPSVVPGTTYNLGTWYQSTGITQFALYYRNTSGAWLYWDSSPWFAPATTWTQATYVTKPVPSDATAVTFGLALITNGTLTTDDYSFVDPGTAAQTTTAATSPRAAVRLTTKALLAARARTHSAKVGSLLLPASHVLSHERPQLVGGQGVRPGTLIPVPEWGRPAAG